MTTDANAEGAPADGSSPVEGAAERPRGSRWLTVVGIVVLVVGVAVFVVGRLAASNASDDLAAANRKLHAQQQATAASNRCEASLRTAMAPAVMTAQAVVASAGTIADQDAQIVAALGDQRVVGSQARIDDYNNARDRGNAAADAANAAVDAGRSQAKTLQQQAAALPSCAASAAPAAAGRPGERGVDALGTR